MPRGCQHVARSGSRLSPQCLDICAVTKDWISVGPRKPVQQSSAAGLRWRSDARTSPETFLSTEGLSWHSPIF